MKAGQGLDSTLSSTVAEFRLAGTGANSHCGTSSDHYDDGPVLLIWSCVAVGRPTDQLLVDLTLATLGLWV